VNEDQDLQRWPTVDAWLAAKLRAAADLHSAGEAAAYGVRLYGAPRQVDVSWPRCSAQSPCECGALDDWERRPDGDWVCTRCGVLDADAERPLASLPSVAASLAASWPFLGASSRLRRLVKDPRVTLMFTDGQRFETEGGGLGETLQAMQGRKGGRRPAREPWAWTGACMDARDHLVPVPPYVAPGPQCDRRGVRVLLECGVGHQFWMWQPCKCGDCATCRPAVDKRKAARVAQSLAGEPFGAWVLTLPRSWGPRTTPGRANELRLLAIEVVRAAVAPLVWSQAIQRHGQELARQGAAPADLARLLGDPADLRAGGVAAVHPVGESCDACGNASKDVGHLGLCPNCGETPAPHVHVDLTCATLWLTGSGFPVDAPLFLPPEVLDRAKNLWWLVLAMLAEIGGLDVPTVAQLHYSFRRRIPQRVHRLGYCVRGFPAWRPAMGSAATARRWGLASGGALLAQDPARRAAISDWQDLVSQERPQERDPCRCQAPGCLLIVDVVGIYKPGAPELSRAEPYKAQPVERDKWVRGPP